MVKLNIFWAQQEINFSEQGWNAWKNGPKRSKAEPDRKWHRIFNFVLIFNTVVLDSIPGHVTFLLPVWYPLLYTY